ncbi:MAG: hypothetical protein J7513_11305 [Solirubrobacteraceae bacterium]|nr:hypothetical protein [Solirubrobacteraceae bacterium]
MLAAPDTTWITYDQWNAAISDEFFSGRYGGRPVYLDLEDAALLRIADAAGEGADDPQAALIDAVGATLALRERASIFGAHRRRLAEWSRAGRQGPPPVIGVLALLSLVAEQMAADEEFRASNYYGRFLRTLGYSAEDSNLRQKVVRCFGEETHVLWAALNGWLAEDPGTRGVATAFAFDYRVHVGLPMSQALVREADREALTDLFTEFRLSPGQRLERVDMLRLLQKWLPVASVSSALRAFCQNDEALQRVADVACIELASWTGASAATRRSSGRLALVATFRKKPRPRLSLGLCARVGDSGVRELTLTAAAGPGARGALGHAQGRLLLAEAEQEGWADVVNVADISFPRALATVLALQGGAVTVRRQPRRLVVLVFDEERRRFVETDRVRLGDQYLLLASDSLVPLLDAALIEAARPGWIKHSEGSVTGVPAGWTFYNRVEIVSITTAKHLDLAALVPVAWTQLSLSGGLALPGRGQWLVQAPPQLSASSLTGEPVIAILSAVADEAEEVEDSSAEQASVERADDALTEIWGGPAADDAEDSWPAPDDVVLGDVDPVAIIDLAGRGLQVGSYRLSLHETGGDHAALATLSLTLLEPQPPADKTNDCAYPLPLRGAGVVGAQPGSQGIRGAVIPTAEIEEPEALELGSQLADWSPDAAEVDEVTAYVDAGEEPAADGAARCMSTGAHLFRLPRTDEIPKGVREYGEVCEYCGLEKTFPTRPRPRTASQTSLRGSRLVGATAVSGLPSREDEADGCDFDLLLSALCTVGSGSWRSFEQLVNEMDDQPWAASHAAQVLTALAHLDVAYDARTARPCAWSVAPPTLVQCDDGAFLAGWRSQPLWEAVERLAADLGIPAWRGSAERTGVTVMRIGDLDDDDLWLLAAELSDAIGTEVHIATNAPRRLLAQLPALSAVRADLPIGHPPFDEAVQRFDPASGRWRDVDSAALPGGYRTSGLPRSFWHFDGADWRRTGTQLVKWLAADDPASMLAYDSTTGRLACHLGCPLPGLFERAAVLCSGTAGQLTEAGHIVYEGIAPSMAAGLFRRLSPTPVTLANVH